MRQIFQFVCEKCGCAYNEESKAISCESYHILVEHIVNVDYMCKASGRGKYPRSLKVKMADGKVLRYEYDGRS